MLKQVYLVFYNVLMLVGWLLIFSKIINQLASGKGVYNVYHKISKPLVIVQTAAVIETFHSLFKLVRSPVTTTFLQVLSRLLVLYGAIEVGPTDSRTSPFFTQMVVAWSLSEIIRYLYYVANLMNIKFGLLMWLRYSAFTVLYPIGITGEILCFCLALPYIKANKPWSMELPNRFNWSFSWYTSVWFLLIVLYPYGSYVMYSYMLQQRRKMLSATLSTTEKKKV